MGDGQVEREKMGRGREQRRLERGKESDEGVAMGRDNEEAHLEDWEATRNVSRGNFTKLVRKGFAQNKLVFYSLTQ